MEDYLLLLDRRSMTVTVEDQTIRVDRPGHRPERIPVYMINRVIVYGSPMVSCDVWVKLSEAGVPALLLPGRGPGGSACLTSNQSAAPMIRIRQHQAQSDETVRTIVARYFVARKLSLLERLLDRLQKDILSSLAPDVAAKVKKGAKKIKKAQKDISACRQALDETDSIDSIRGHEGRAAACWFTLLVDLLPRAYAFTGRNRRPPRDPVNALLSLSYTMALLEVRQGVQLRGLDSGVGFLHQPRAGKEALLLDLLEPLRPVIDMSVLMMLGTLLRPSHFRMSEENGCRLTKKGRSLYYRHWSSVRLLWPDFACGKGASSFPEHDESGGVTLESAVRHEVKALIELWPQQVAG